MSGVAGGPFSGVTVRDREGRRIGTIAPGPVGRWCVTVGSILLAAQQVLTAAPGTPWWPAPLVVLLAVVAADVPDSGFPLVTLGTTAGWWVLVVRDPAPGATLVVAGAFLVFHLVTAHSAVGPPGRAADAAVVRALLVRLGLVGTATLGIGMLAAALTDRVDVPPGGLVAALLALGALAWLTTRQ